MLSNIFIPTCELLAKRSPFDDIDDHRIYLFATVSDDGNIDDLSRYLM